MSPPTNKPSEERLNTIFSDMTTLLWFTSTYTDDRPITSIKAQYIANRNEGVGGHTSSNCRRVAHDLIDAGRFIKDPSSESRFDTYIDDALCNLESWFDEDGLDWEPLKEIKNFMINRVIEFTNNPHIKHLKTVYEFNSDKM